MRFFGKAAIAAIVIMAALTPVTASAQEGHRIAVVDVAYIFKNHPGIKKQVEEVESALKSFEADLKAKRTELQQAAEQLKAFKVGSPDYRDQEEKIASLESKLRLDMQRTRQLLAEKEAKIYFDNYQMISGGVKYLANYYKINLVLRYNSEDMNKDNGDSVIRGVMKNIVYHDDSLDMTKGVMQYLDQQMQKKVAQGAATNR